MALGSGSIADASNTVSVGARGNERRVTNVAPGLLNTDAANFGQLLEVRQESRRGIAGVASIVDYTRPGLPGETAVNVGIGQYKDQSAMGFGISHWLKIGDEDKQDTIRRVTIGAGASVSEGGGEDNVYQVGVGFVF